MRFRPSCITSYPKTIVENDDSHTFHTFSPFASIDHKTASMAKKQPNQTAFLIATNNIAIVYIHIGELNESYSLLSEAVTNLQKIIREQPPNKARLFVLSFSGTILRIPMPTTHSNHRTRVFFRFCFFNHRQAQKTRNPPSQQALPLWSLFGHSLQSCSGGSSSRCSKRRIWQVFLSPRSQDTVRYRLCMCTIETTMFGRLYGTTHGHFEQSGIYVHGIGYRRAGYQLLRSITQATNENERIQQQIAGCVYRQKYVLKLTAASCAMTSCVVFSTSLTCSWSASVALTIEAFTNHGVV
jgi:hypothetical protein